MAGNRIMGLAWACGAAPPWVGRSHQFAFFVADQWAMLFPSQVRVVASAAALPRRPLTEADAVDLWIARWLRMRRKDLVARYGCDPRRLYEVWEEARFAGSRAKAQVLFAERYPTLLDRIDYGPHRRIPRAIPPELQPGLFD